MHALTRRRFLTTGLMAGVAGTLPWRRARAAEPVLLRATRRTITVNGRVAVVFGLTQPDGTPGLVTEAGRRFRVALANELDAETLVHWHGLTPPSDQDGVPGLSQPPLAAGGRYDYDFALTRPGTYWMHSHVGLQEQRLLAAPLIVHEPAEAGFDEQEAVVMLHDFTFRDPAEIFAELTGGMAMMDHGNMAGMDMGGMAMGDAPAASGGAGMDDEAMGPGAGGGMAMDLNDVDYDAYLANDRTLDDPEVVRVERGGRIRLRLINAAASTNFFIDLGALSGDLIAVDGHPVVPVTGRRFELAIAQRIDIRVALPNEAGAWPVLALREGDTPRTGIVLATARAAIARIPSRGDAAAGVVGLDLDRRLVATMPLPARPADRRHVIELTGSMMNYVWTLNGTAFGKDTPLALRQGERVEILLRNATDMAHPMHLHGHVFQVVAIDGTPLAGALRDTVMVPIRASVTIAFDADNPGHWALHCHNLYHMLAGMMTSLRYES